MSRRGGRLAPPRIAPMYGPSRLLTISEAGDLVLRYSNSRTDSQVLVDVAKRIATHGECLVHAYHEVTGSPCWGFCCKPEAA